MRQVKPTNFFCFWDTTDKESVRMQITTIEQVLLLASLTLFISIFASKIAVRFGVPALLLFLVLGMLAGSEGVLGIYFDYPFIVQSIGVVALAYILFSGGLDTHWRTTRTVLKEGIALSTIGVLITALIMGGFLVVTLGMSWSEGVLLGAIIASTDAAAVFSVLRGKGLHLKGRLKPILELESGSNDPMAVFLTVGMIQLITTPSMSALDLIPLFVLQMGIGAIMGLVMGRAMVWLLNRLQLEYDGLYPVVTLASVMLTYGLTAILSGNGFLAVYLLGMYMGNERFIHKRSLLQFHDGIGWLMQIAMFLVLGLQVYPRQLLPIAPIGLLTGSFLLFVARPASVFLAIFWARLSWKELAFISWGGLRGASPIMLATFPLLADVKQAPFLFNLVFFVVLVSVLLQGTLLAWLADRLNLSDDKPEPVSPIGLFLKGGGSNEPLELTLEANSFAVGRRLLDLQLPAHTLIALITRGKNIIAPNGGTVLEAGDTLLIIAPLTLHKRLRSFFSLKNS